MPLHWLDYVIIAIVGLSVLTGLFRGFIKELLSLCVWIVAIWLAFTYSSSLAPWLQPYVHDKTARMAITFVVILLVTILVGALITTLLSFIMHRSGLSGTDRLLGMGFGFVRGVFIVALLFVVAKIAAVPSEEYRKESYLYAKFDPLVNWFYGFMPDFIKKMKVLEKNDAAIDIKPAP